MQEILLFDFCDSIGRVDLNIIFIVGHRRGGTPLNTSLASEQGPYVSAVSHEGSCLTWTT